MVKFSISLGWKEFADFFQTEVPVTDYELQTVAGQYADYIAKLLRARCEARYNNESPVIAITIRPYGKEAVVVADYPENEDDASNLLREVCDDANSHVTKWFAVGHEKSE